jgi:hypothetical protein
MPTSEAHHGGGNGGDESSKSGGGNSGLAQTGGRWGWGVVRCGASLLREDWSAGKARRSQRLVACKGGSADGFVEKKWRGAARSHHTEEKGGVGLDKRAVAPQSRRARATFGQGRQWEGRWFVATVPGFKFVNWVKPFNQIWIQILNPFKLLLIQTRPSHGQKIWNKIWRWRFWQVEQLPVYKLLHIQIIFRTKNQRSFWGLNLKEIWGISSWDLIFLWNLGKGPLIELRCKLNLRKRVWCAN